MYAMGTILGDETEHFFFFFFFFNKTNGWNTNCITTQFLKLLLSSHNTCFHGEARQNFESSHDKTYNKTCATSMNIQHKPLSTRKDTLF